PHAPRPTPHTGDGNFLHGLSLTIGTATDGDPTAPGRWSAWMRGRGKFDPTRRTWSPAGSALGLGLLLAWLLAWRLVADAAEWFAPATACVGLIAWPLSARPACRARPAVAAGLRLASWAALGLAVAAALSLGAFLPA